VTLYECVTGENPFRDVNKYEQMHAIVSKLVPPPSSREAPLPAAFDQVVLRAMHRDPLMRFASVDELAEALLAFASEAVAARWRIEFAAHGAR
jgi:serine/threonine-protein kinase